MKTVEIYYTQDSDETDDDGNVVTEDVIEKEYTCEDGKEQNLLHRARLTAELWTRDKETLFRARIHKDNT